MSVTTLSELFLHAAGHGRSDLLRFKSDGEWQSLSTAELVDRVRRLARGMEHHGLAAGDRVAIFAGNGPHWPTIDFATLCSGAVVVPVYSTLLPDQAAYILRDCGAKIVFAETADSLDGLLAIRDRLPEVEMFVTIEERGAESSDAGVTLTTLEGLVEQGADIDPEAFGDRAHAVKPDDLATFVYTSGTTGQPKGVMLTHGNVVSNVLASLEVVPVESHYQALCFLPLAHAFERTIDYIYFYQGCSIAYAESVQAIAANLQEIKPHLFVSVPRIYEKFLAKVQDNVAGGSSFQQKVFAWAVDVARRSLSQRLRDKRPGGWLGLQLGLAERLVFNKVRERLGGRFVFAVSGGAPLARDVAEFFWGAGLRIFEGYGLSESSPVLTVNPPGAAKLGTVGPPIPGVELKIAEDGEILAHGPNIMRGYFNLKEETAEVIDDDGWLRTGDIGELDADGYLTITDRKKELIKNAYGKYIAPAAVEAALKSSRYISQAVVVGERRKFAGALIVPDFEALAAWGRSRSLDLSDPATAIKNDPVRQLIDSEVAAANGKLAHHEEVRAWALLPRELSLEEGEMTPTQKVKRKVVIERFADLIDDMYEDAIRGFESTS